MRIRRLREAAPRALEPLLEEEAAQWRSELGWDFAGVRQAVSAGIERGTLAGRLIEQGGEACAYSYYLADAERVIIGSIFAGRRNRGQGLEEALVAAVVEDARAERGGGRVECQTLFCTSSGADTGFGRAGFTGRARHYLRRDLGEPLPSGPSLLPAGVRLRPLRRDELSLAAELVYRSHQGSVDAALNLTYATPAACRHFVETLVLRSGCGSFDPEASRVAEGERGALGVLIASRLSDSTGHLCQVSVVPEAQSRGLGGALVAAALRAFKAAALTAATLSVTVANERARRLYENLGFRLHRGFVAHAWVRPPARLGLPA